MIVLLQMILPFYITKSIPMYSEDKMLFKTQFFCIVKSLIIMPAFTFFFVSNNIWSTHSLGSANRLERLFVAGMLMATNKKKTIEMSEITQSRVLHHTGKKLYVHKSHIHEIYEYIF